jgi:hypothetical protein
MNLKIPLNQLSAEPRAGNVALRTFETMEPVPKLIIIVPRVAIKGGNFSRLTRIPLKRPKEVATMMIRIKESHIGHPQVLYAVPPMIVAAIITVPQERSIPPVIMTNVTPIAKNPI